MAKYRIIPIDIGPEKWWKLQKRFLFFWVYVRISCRKEQLQALVEHLKEPPQYLGA